VGNRGFNSSVKKHVLPWRKDVTKWSRNRKFMGWKVSRGNPPIGSNINGSNAIGQRQRDSRADTQGSKILRKFNPMKHLIHSWGVIAAEELQILQLLKNS
jgi:hypothetical protein